MKRDTELFILGLLGGGAITSLAPDLVSSIEHIEQGRGGLVKSAWCAVIVVMMLAIYAAYRMDK